jgi:DNA-binding NarL/FixJ family response regulator
MALLSFTFEDPRSTRATGDEVSGLWRTPHSDGDPRASLPESVWTAAANADVGSMPATDLASVWQDVIEGRLAIHGEGRSSARKYVLLRTNVNSSAPRGALTRIETSVLVRVLCGEQQKLVAAELEIACSTASKWYTHALAKLRLGAGPLPLPLVIAAQGWASGHVPSVGARSAFFEFEGDEFLLLSVVNPRIAGETPLTQAEQEVATLLIEGGSRWEIATHRCTSAQTVACQLRGIFSKLRLTGRHALIARAVELGWFGESE